MSGASVRLMSTADAASNSPPPMATAWRSLSWSGGTAHHGPMSQTTTETQPPTIQPIPDGLAERASLLGGTEGGLRDEQIRGSVAEQLAGQDPHGKAALLTIPHGPRHHPPAQA